MMFEIFQKANTFKICNTLQTSVNWTRTIVQSLTYSAKWAIQLLLCCYSRERAWSSKLEKFRDVDELVMNIVSANIGEKRDNGKLVEDYKKAISYKSTSRSPSVGLIDFVFTSNNLVAEPISISTSESVKTPNIPDVHLGVYLTSTHSGGVDGGGGCIEISSSAVSNTAEDEPAKIFSKICRTLAKLLIPIALVCIFTL